MHLLCNHLLTLDSIQKNQRARDFLTELKNSVSSQLAKHFSCSEKSLPDYLRTVIGSFLIADWRIADKVDTHLIYLSDEQRENFVTVIDSSGKIAFQKEMNAETHLTEDDEMEEREFVFSLDGRLYVHDTTRMQSIASEDQKVKHSSFLSGGDVLCAGMIKVKNGEIVSINNDSGHYTPSFRETALFLFHLRDRGVDLSKITLNLKHPELAVKANVFLALSGAHRLLKTLEKAQDIKRKSYEFQDAIAFEIQYHAKYPEGDLKAFLDNLTKELESLNNENSSVSNAEAPPKLSKEEIIAKQTEKSRAIAEKSAQLWLQHFEDSYYSTAARAAVENISKMQNFNKEVFRQALEEKGCKYEDISIDATIKCETSESDASVYQTEQIRKTLEDLRAVIHDTKWKTFFRDSLSFFSKKIFLPKTIEKILNRINTSLADGNHAAMEQGLVDIIDLSAKAAVRTDFRRSVESQFFYELVNTLEFPMKTPKCMSMERSAS